ncbi:hypothetical protein [Rhizobium sp. 11515TR]|uniref:hypothetical protein n=1 Tax=Rhizobium sp. 11515TR TaxID=2028343 RepID=UPI000BA869C9|nr:hypothetical protein [Rhizobium sp. 11515TR]ASW07310.1 hypothetical protein CKA34_16330 [Rhizobium sp. 11515TR]
MAVLSFILSGMPFSSLQKIKAAAAFEITIRLAAVFKKRSSKWLTDNIKSARHLKAGGEATPLSC